MKKIIISGEGGQGVRIISHTMAILLTNIGYEVALLYDYDSDVRGAMSVAYLTFAREAIDNPVVTEADILIKLSDKADGFLARKTVCQTGLCTDEEIPFSKLGKDKFGREIFGNMIALGRLIGLVDIEISDEELTSILPAKYKEENLSAVHFGYSLKEADLDSTRTQDVDFRSARPGTIDPDNEE